MWLNNAKGHRINEMMGDQPEKSRTGWLTYVGCEAQLRAILSAQPHI
jgi:hypothetical protein